MSTTLTDRDVKNGYKFDYELSWRDVIPCNFMPTNLAELLDTLHSFIPFDCDVRIVDGKINLDHWDTERRREELTSWVKHCQREGLITTSEYIHLWQQICYVE